MVPRLSRRSYVTAVAAVAGCGGRESGTAAEEPSPTATETETATETATEHSTIPESEIIAFASLSDAGKAFFKELLPVSYLERRSDRVPEKIWTEPYVRYEGQLYDLKKEPTNDAVAEYALHIESERSTVSDEASTIAYSSLSDGAKSLFRSALSNENNRTEPSGTRPPEVFSEYEYVAYEGRYYRTLVSVADIQIWRFSAAPVQST